METKETWRGHTDSETECDIKNPLQSFSFKSYLREEVLQSSRRRNEVNSVQEQISGPFRNRVWKFLSIPQYFESFMFYGLLQCLDHILMVYTFLPLRCVVTLFSLLTSSALSLVGLCIPSLGRRELTLYATDAKELVKFSFVCICTLFLYTFDSSIAYHEIRTQSVIKIYIFFNLLEVADRLLSAVNLDAIDDVLFTVSAGLSGLRRRRAPSADGDTHTAASSEAGGFGAFIVQYLFALVCISAHCLLLLAQVTTLNVAFNSQNRSLLTVIISNNFVELKGNVFRKMGKSNLFQIACADVRERFHYTVWLFIIVCRNMSASGWQYEDFLALLPDILLIFLAEVAVDWIKHAFISKFNVIASDVYEEYTVSIAYDLLLCHQGKNTSDYFELLARRMGLTPISLSCLINVMIIQTVKSSWIYVFLLLALPLLFAFKVLAHIVLLNRAYTHVQAYTQMMTAKLAKETVSTTATAQFSNKTSNLPSGKGPAEGDAPKRKTSMFYPPYTGYDQPTRDDYQLAMPHLPYRRTHSDSTCISMPHAVKEGTPRLPQSYDPGDTAESIDEFSSLNSFPTNSGETPVHQRPPPPPPPQKGILKAVGWPVEEAEVGEETDSRFRQFLLDADDMQICRRRNIVIPSLPSSPTETAVIETRNQDRSSPTPPATASTFFKSQPSNPLFSAVTLHPVPLTSSRKASPKRHLGTQRRRCFSLDDLVSVSPHQDRIQHPAAPDSSSTHVVGNGRNPAPLKRCRLHTETEISSSIILEQLNSVLNDETAHLEDAVDVDLLSTDEISALESEGVEELGAGDGEHDKVWNVTSSSNTCGAVTSADTSVIDQVKQPLSNVDRYSMLGGQIS